MGYVTDLQEAICDNICTLISVDSYEGMVEELKQLMEGEDGRTPKGPPTALILLDEFNSLLMKAEAKEAPQNNLNNFTALALGFSGGWYSSTHREIHGAQYSGNASDRPLL